MQIGILSNHRRRYAIAIVVVIIFLRANWPAAIAIAAAPPDSGAVLDSVKQPENQPPTEGVPGDITITEPAATSPSGSQQKIRVNGFCFYGETIVPEKQLQRLIADQAGRDLTLDDLRGLALKITKFLRHKGYLVASAYLPAQRVKGGIVTITVIPGKYGAVKINNRAHIKIKHLQAILAPLKPGAIITRRSLERVLLLLNDLAGIETQATLAPGQTPGSADFLLEVRDSAKAGGDFHNDNWGSRYTGQNRGGCLVSLNNLAGLGDMFSLSGIVAGNGMANGGVEYAIPLWDSGMKLDLRYSHTNYWLGEDFAALNAGGTADVYGIGLSYPLIRSRKFNLYGAIGFDDKQLQDYFNNGSVNKSRTSNLWNIRITGNEADTWGNGGFTSFSLAYSGGYLAIHDSDAAATDAAGSYHKLVLNASRRQILHPNLNLDFICSGQLADHNLDSSEKFYLGGADGVRAYPQGEAAGDEGIRATAELQWRIPQLSTATTGLALALFSDYGYVTVNKDPWDGDVNTRSLYDAGLGVIWDPGAGFHIRCDYAFKIGSETARSETDQSGRFWFRAVKSF